MFACVRAHTEGGGGGPLGLGLCLSLLAEGGVSACLQIQYACGSFCSLQMVDVLCARPGYLMHSISLIKDKYGSLDAFFTSPDGLNIASDQLEKFRQCMTVPV